MMMNNDDDDDIDNEVADDDDDEYDDVDAAVVSIDIDADGPMVSSCSMTSRPMML